MPNPLTLYGVPFSQPVRAVMWLLMYKRTPFNMALIIPGATGENGSRSPEYLAKNPGGTIPCIEEDDGFVLAEAHAILCYLCNRHGWTDMYPDDSRARARIDWYLHYHHRNLRDASLGLVAPKVRKDLNIPQAMQQSAQATFARALRALDEGWLAQTRYLTANQPNIADLAAYVEIGQLRDGFTNIYDFSPFKNVQRWLDDMRQLPGHDDAHIVLAELGDISEEAPTMERIREANMRALSTLKMRLA